MQDFFLNFLVTVVDIRAVELSFVFDLVWRRMQTAQLNSILKRQATPTKSPSVRRAKQSPKVRQPLGENPNPSRGNTPNVNAIQGALKSAFKQQPIEVGFPDIYEVFEGVDCLFVY